MSRDHVLKEKHESLQLKEKGLKKNKLDSWEMKRGRVDIKKTTQDILYYNVSSK